MKDTVFSEGFTDFTSCLTDKGLPIKSRGVLRLFFGFVFLFSKAQVTVKADVFQRWPPSEITCLKETLACKSLKEMSFKKKKKKT